LLSVYFVPSINEWKGLSKRMSPKVLTRMDPNGAQTNIAMIAIVWMFSPYSMYSAFPTFLAAARNNPLTVAYTVALGIQQIEMNILSFIVYLFEEAIMKATAALTDTPIKIMPTALPTYATTMFLKTN
jgi:hypothetical protein